MVRAAQHLVYAIHEYALPGSGFLQLRAADVLHVDDADESGWWLGTNLRGQKGVFPSTYTLPYVFPEPPDDLVRDAQLILLGLQHGVDVTSGAPLPLRSIAADACDDGAPMLSMTHLCRQMEEHLVQREAARTLVLERLTELVDLSSRARDARAAEARAVAAQRREAEVCRAAVEAKRMELRRALESIAERKASLLAMETVPPCEWYEQFNELSAAAASEPLSHTAAWRTTVKEVKRVVQQQEERLTRLSATCAEQEAVFAQTAAALQARVEWRDDCVAAMLGHWAAKACDAKAAYTAAKVERDTAEEALQLEAASLLCRLADGREQYVAAKETLRHVKRAAEEIAAALQRKDALDTLSHQIEELDAALAQHSCAAHRGVREAAA
ncbi:SH3 domain/Variant SH3 domain containing protein [Novymonas esmeraldas]|uniref:SH3 domain/Variant SH3 domain containing protein n=1 Tax=Novymonas esmeraldas TaxID=1808958 RepID=A0AAW0EYK5_9TRYP